MSKTLRQELREAILRTLEKKTNPELKAFILEKESFKEVKLI